MLDALEVALEHADVPTIRPRIEHAQIMDSEDIVRLGKTGGKCIRLFRDTESTADRRISSDCECPTYSRVGRILLLLDCAKVLSCL